VASTPIVCLSHVAWSSGAGHPCRLMTRFARQRGVYVLEARRERSRMPLLGSARSGEVTVLTRYLPAELGCDEEPRVLAPLLDALLESEGVALPILWVCDAQALPVARRLRSSAVVYDCPWGLEYEHAPERAAAESAILRVADLVLVHGARDATRLRGRHPLVHVLPDDGPQLSAASGASVVQLLDDLLHTLVAARGRALPAGVPVRAVRPRGATRSPFLH
jgi:UDP-galactopyranose mutase